MHVYMIIQKDKNKLIKMVVSMISLLFEEILTAVNINLKFLLDVMACSLVEGYDVFRGKFADEKRQVSPKCL